MFKKLLVIATLAAGLISTQASAAFVSTDWKTNGDSLATLDTKTGLEWLDLTQTAYKSINQVKSELSTLYVGWRMPTYDEMVILSRNIYPTVISSAFSSPNRTSTYYSGEGSAHVLFGANVPGYYYGSYELNGRTQMFGRNAVAGVMHFNWDWANHLNFSSSYDGVYLVSDGGTTMSSINDPSLNINNPNAPINTADVSAPLGLAGAGLLMLMLGARRKAV